MKTDYNCQAGQKLIIKEKGKFHQVEIEQISHITCSGYVCTIRQSNHYEDIIVSKLLKDFESELGEMGFFRANRNTLVNLNNMAGYEHNEKLFIIMRDDEKVIISRRRLPDFFRLINT